jgi:hypothetical protein
MNGFVPAFDSFHNWLWHSCLCSHLGRIIVMYHSADITEFFLWCAMNRFVPAIRQFSWLVVALLSAALI